jgi:hypothetical protein
MVPILPLRLTSATGDRPADVTDRISRRDERPSARVKVSDDAEVNLPTAEWVTAVGLWLVAK